MKVELMDTTLRDGEQTSGVAFTDMEKLSIAKMLLDEVGVDRIEIASARVSPGEFEASRKILSWAASKGCLDSVEILGFVDGGKSVDWIRDAGGKLMNLLCKGSLKHARIQLKKTPEEHISDIKGAVLFAAKSGIETNVYLEDWSNGMKESPEYVYLLLSSLRDLKIKRFMLPDTLGILTPDDTYRYCREVISRFPDLKFDFHGHNDYDLSVANSLAAVKAGCSGVHATVNGLGERAGNTPLASLAAVLKDHLSCELSIRENMLVKISKLVETFAGLRISANKPIVGDHVFTQTCGVHADGDSKGNLYYNNLMPERFGRVRKYALGKSSGKASIKKNLEDLGIELDPGSMAKVTEMVVELGDKKKNITAEDLPYIISDVLGSGTLKEKIKIRNYYICNAYGLKPVATLCVEIDGKTYEETATGDGQYDAFMKALSKIYASIGKCLPTLTDYVVTIPPGGSTEALVETVITWEHNKEFKTRGLDSDQTAAAIKATLKMLNLMEQF
ncbi:MAG: alpha-isopropylmalate synthase regulatory domain-containing protein [Bacillota bacterium]